MTSGLVPEARDIAERIIRWCDDDRASAVILGHLSAELTALCRHYGPCGECGYPGDMCREIWAQQRKCCPDCTHA